MSRWMISAVVLVATVVGAGAWYVMSPNGPIAMRGTVTRQAETIVYLVPTSPPPKDRKPAQEVWRTLFSEITDPMTSGSTITILGMCYGDPALKLVVGKSGEAEPNLAPMLADADRSSMAMYIMPTQPALEDWPSIVARVGGRSDKPIECLLGDLKVRVLARIAKPAAPSKVPRERAAEVDFDDVKALLLAANDRLLTRRTGYMLLTAEEGRKYLENPASIDGERAIMDNMRLRHAWIGLE